MLKKRYLMSDLILIVLLVSLGFLISKSIDIEKELDIPSKCYTTLEPSSFLSTISPSPITINYLQSYIKIDIKNRDFFYIQTAGTGSMRPFLRKVSSVILIKPLVEDIKVGDVVTFNCDNINIIHRVIEIENGVYTTKGDNNNIEDTKCITKFEDITGRVVGVLY